jgi:hypothetical protein
MDKRKETQEKHYFKIEKDFLKLEEKALSKKALLLYILHCRRINKKKNMSCSLSGAKDSKVNFGFSKNTHKKATEELIEKHLIAKRPDVKTGMLKTTAVEILPFPEYLKSKNTFSKNKKYKYRDYKKGEYINVPSKLVDDKILASLKIEEIFALLWLYAETDLIECRGVNHDFIHFYNDSKKGYSQYSTFGEAFHRSIHGKKCAITINPHNVRVPDLDFPGNLEETIKSLLDKKLIYLAPVFLYQDPEDRDITRVEGEIFKGLVGFENQDTKDMYLFLEPGGNTKVIWILRTKYLVEGDAHKIYKDMQKANKRRDEYLYTYHDYETAATTKKELISNEESFYSFSDYLHDWKHSCYKKVEEYLGDFSIENVEKIVDILPGYIFWVYENEYKGLEEY